MAWDSDVVGRQPERVRRAGNLAAWLSLRVILCGAAFLARPPVARCSPNYVRQDADDNELLFTVPLGPSTYLIHPTRAAAKREEVLARLDPGACDYEIVEVYPSGSMRRLLLGIDSLGKSGSVIFGRSLHGYFTRGQHASVRTDWFFLLETSGLGIEHEPRFFAASSELRAALVELGVRDLSMSAPAGLTSGLSDPEMRPWRYVMFRNRFSLADPIWAVGIGAFGSLIGLLASLFCERRPVRVSAVCCGVIGIVLAQLVWPPRTYAGSLGFPFFPTLLVLVASWMHARKKLLFDFGCTCFIGSAAAKGNSLAIALPCAGSVGDVLTAATPPVLDYENPRTRVPLKCGPFYWALAAAITEHLVVALAAVLATNNGDAGQLARLSAAVAIVYWCGLFVFAASGRWRRASWRLIYVAIGYPMMLAPAARTLLGW